MSSLCCERVLSALLLSLVSDNFVVCLNDVNGAVLRCSGWNSRFSHKHLYQRLFSSRITACDDGLGFSDLLFTFNQEVEKIDPKAISRYLCAVLNREDITSEVGRVAALSLSLFLFLSCFSLKGTKRSLMDRVND